MNFVSLFHIELAKIRRSGILLILAASAVMLWLPSIFNAYINFEMQAEGISPEHNFFIQGFMGMAWFMFPASMVVGTVLLNQAEQKNRGILKMLTLPVSPVKLCLAKFSILQLLAAAQMLMTLIMYVVSALISARTQDYRFLLGASFVLKEVGMMYLASIPMTSFFWLLAVYTRAPVFSISIGLASIVPSVLMINTKVWFAYPMCYPLYVIASEYGKLAENLASSGVDLLPWAPAAAAIALVCLAGSCLMFGKGAARSEKADG